MDKIKFVMTNTSDIVTEVCREALEAKGVTVMVCDKNGTAALNVDGLAGWKTSPALSVLRTPGFFPILRRVCRC